MGGRIRFPPRRKSENQIAIEPLPPSATPPGNFWLVFENGCRAVTWQVASPKIMPFAPHRIAVAGFSFGGVVQGG